MLIVLRYLISIAQLMLNLYFMGNYLYRKRTSRVPVTLFILTIPIVVLALNTFDIAILNLLSALVATVGLSALFFKEPWKRTIAVGVATYALNMFCELVLLFLTSVIFAATAIELTQNDYADIVFSILAMLAFFVISWIIRSFVKKRNFSGKPLIVVPSWRYILLPVSLVLVGYYVLYCTLAYSGPFLSWLSLAILISLILVDAVLLFGSERESRKYELQSELTAMQLQNDLTEEIIKLQEQYLDSIKGQAHDFKKHLIHINDMLVEQTSNIADTEMKEYIVDVIDDLNKVDTAAFPDVKNNALRVILTKTADTCKSNGIFFRTSLDYCELSFMSYKDICGIFLNALENAIQACRSIDETQQRYIELNIRCPEKIVQIHISNPNPGVIKDASGALVTTKEDSYFHGYGLKNIERVVRQYDGIVITDFPENKFDLFIDIPLPDFTDERQVDAS